MEQVGVLLVEGTLVVGALTWLTKKLVETWMSTRSEAFKVELEASHRTTLESHSQQLRAQHERDLRQFDAEIRERDYARESVLDRLLDRQMEVAAVLYGLLEEAHSSLHSLMRPFQKAGEPDEDEKRKKAAEAANEFLRYYRKHKIFVTPQVCDLVDRVAGQMNDAWFQFVEVRDIWNFAGSPEAGLKDLEARKAAWAVVVGEMEPLLEELLVAFRKMTGIVEQAQMSRRVTAQAEPGGNDG